MAPADSQTAPTYRSAKQSVSAANSGVSDSARAGANHFLGILAAEVSGGVVDLPCFPNVVLRIRTALADARTTPERTVSIVGTEPRLAAKLLQTANSVAFNTSGKPVTELRTAVTRLGHNYVQSAAMAYAVQQVKSEQALRSIAPRLSELWKECIAVASIAQVVAKQTKVSPDEAFLTGLLHGIGRLYILVRAVEKFPQAANPDFLDLVIGWHASIGKAILENWGFAQQMSAAVGDQTDYERRISTMPDLTDVLVTSIHLAEVQSMPGPRVIQIQGVNSFQSIGLSVDVCAAILQHADYRLASLHEALGC